MAALTEYPPRSPRIDGWALAAWISLDNHTWHEATANAVNGDGVNIHTDRGDNIAVGQTLTVELQYDPFIPGILEPIRETMTGTVVWSHGASFGIRFKKPSMRLNALAERTAARYS
jgi:hypothetical protein